MRPLPLVLAIAVAGLASPAAGRPAATCSDYSTQADAQRAADTRDADHDGVYCETLPCPCAKGGAPTRAPKPRGRPHHLGPSVRLGRVTRSSGCRVHDGLPDSACTPGVYFAGAGKADVCRTGYSARVRNVRGGTATAVYAAYGVSERFDGADGELDHLVSLELGGSNARANLFPESARPSPGAAEKDRLENALHAEVCAGEITLRHAQRLIATDWTAAYRERFG